MNSLPNQSETYDVILLGGGIVGSGIARDCAQRGLKVALYEREDYGYGTTSRSTRLIHGGLRYLEMLDFGLVRQDLKEREILLKIAPHRVQPLPFILPFYRCSLLYRLKVRVGMLLYDLLSYDKTLPNHRYLTRAETLAMEEGLNAKGLQGAAMYYDCQVAFPERLCLDNILSAQRDGASVFNHTEVIDILTAQNQPFNKSPSPHLGGKACGVRVRNRLTGEESEFRGRLIINATGAWVDRLLKGWKTPLPPQLRLTKGIHFAAPRANKNALVLFSKKDRRLMFAIPWLGYSWIGTTDTDFDANLDTVHALRDEIAYLQETVSEYLPQGDWSEVYFTNAGVRALVHDNRPGASESAVSRKHGVLIHAHSEGLEGMITVLGGKLTAYRDIAEEVVNRACELLEHTMEGRTAATPLPGGERNDLEYLKAEMGRAGSEYGLTQAQADYLVFLYGAEAYAILNRIEHDASLAEPLSRAYPDIKAQVVHAIEAEQAQTLNDFLLRRSLLGFTKDQGEQAIPALIETMAARLGWGAERVAEERAAALAHIARTRQHREAFP